MALTITARTGAHIRTKNTKQQKSTKQNEHLSYGLVTARENIAITAL